MFISIIWLPMFVSMRQDNAPQQCIQYQTIVCFFDAPRIFQSSELVPLKAMAHAIWGRTKNRISLCKPPSPIGADEQSLERLASPSANSDLVCKKTPLHGLLQRQAITTVPYRY